MKQVVYYFSGTGNSQCVAEDIAGRLGMELIPIAALAQYKGMDTDAEMIGIVFPVVYGYPPVIVKEFTAGLKPKPGAYIFAVCTFGGSEMDSLRWMRRTLAKQGVAGFAGFGVHMPQNAFHKPGENVARILAAQSKRCDRIVRQINAGVTGLHYQNALLTWLTIPVVKAIVDPICERLFTKQCGLPEGTDMNQVIRSRDCGFKVKDTCTGCGICAQMCPVENIKIFEGKPVWQHRCENCLACFNWCPSQSIISGLTKKMKPYYYRHPNISMRQYRIKH